MQLVYSAYRARGVIGSHARLRIWCREAWGFESLRAHIRYFKALPGLFYNQNLHTMKKTFFFLLTGLVIVTNIYAQESSVSPVKLIKAEKIYTPQIGDLGISVDILTPVMTYVGNMFNNNTNNTFPSVFSSPSYNGDISISGKYFIYEDFALRASFSVDNSNITSSKYVRNDVAYIENTASIAQVTDECTQSSKNMYMSLGAEIRRGYSRLQGFFGAQLIGGYECQNTSYSYGNDITANNNMPTQGYSSTPTYNIGNNSRLLETNVSGGKDFLIGLGGFVGVEYFILPKMAIGGEVALSVLLVYGGQQSEKSERFNNVDGLLEQNTRLFSEGTNSTTLNTHNFGNSFYVAFYF